MASFDNTKYDVALYPQSATRQGYRLKAYNRTEFNPFIPRLGSGDQSESEFDALKSQTFNSFESGQFARTMKDDTSVYAAEGLYPFYGDGVLWQTNHPTQSAIFGSGKPIVQASCRTRDYTFIGVQQTTGGSTQRVYKCDSTGALTSLTLPASLSGGARAIADMCIYDNKLYISAGQTMSTGSMYYMDLSGAMTTVTEITGGTTYLYRMVVWNGALYGTNGVIAANPNYVLYKWTGDLTTKNAQELARVPTKTADWNAQVRVYNGRIMLFRRDGIWAYDGVRLSPIEDASDRPNNDNFRFPSILRGYLYYWMPDGMYRYNGSSIEKMYDARDMGFPLDMMTAKDRLWILYKNSSALGSSRYDKSLGYDYTSSYTYDGRLVCFDGKGMFTYTRFEPLNKGTMGTSAGDPYKLVFNLAADRMYVNSDQDPGSNHWTLNLSETSVTAAGLGSNSWQVVTPIMDNSFPMVNKMLANCEIVLDGVPASDDEIEVQYRTSGFDGATGWSLLGSFLLGTKTKLDVFNELAGGVTYKRIQLRFYPATTSTISVGIAKFVVRYVLQPDYKYEWTLTALCGGDDPMQPLMLADSTEATDSASALRGNLYAARSQTQPVMFVDVDQMQLTGAIGSADALLALDSASLLKTSGYVLIDDEIMYFSSKSGNNLTLQSRGLFGTAAAVHAANAKAYPLYPVIVKKLISDRIEIDDRGFDTVSGSARDSEITIQLQEV